MEEENNILNIEEVVENGAAPIIGKEENATDGSVVGDIY